MIHLGRPELNSFSECFKSVFRIHTETGNIWTHLIGNQTIPSYLVETKAKERVGERER